MRDYEKAIIYCSKAIEKDPAFMPAYLSRGDNYKALGQIDKAAADYRVACGMKNMAGCVSLGKILK